MLSYRLADLSDSGSPAVAPPSKSIPEVGSYNERQNNIDSDISPAYPLIFIETEKVRNLASILDPSPV